MNSQIHIFSILDSPALGGAEKYILSNLDFLSKNNFKIHLATNNKIIKNNYQKKFEVIDYPYRLDLIGDYKGIIKFFIQAPFSLFWLFKNLIRIKQQSSQVIIYTSGFTERLFFSPFIKLLKIKLIWIEFGPINSVINKNFFLPKFLYNFAKNFPDKIITISQNSKLAMVKYALINQSRIKIIYPGINKIKSIDLKKIKKQGKKWQKQNKLISKKIICFVGRIALEKEIDFLIKAFSNLKSNNTHLIIIGDGPEKTMYQKLAKKLKIDQQTTFTGYLNEKMKNEILSIADVFVFPSAWEMEGFGMTTIEAMMLGIPVVTTGAGPQKEIVANLETGLFFKANNDSDLIKKINYFISNPTQAKKIGFKGREKVAKKFTQGLMNHQTLELIQSVCDETY